MCMVFMVFVFEPVFSAVLQVCTFVTETKWDDTLFAAVCELVQCWLYMLFSGCFINDHDRTVVHTVWLTEDVPVASYDGSTSASQEHARQIAYKVFPSFAGIQLVCLMFRFYWADADKLRAE
eukprot:COSAG03_NODE_17939_length_365_cov_0.781955_1_plen_121_part_11